VLKTGGGLQIFPALLVHTTLHSVPFLDYFCIADQADKNLCDSPLILDCPRAVMGR
jgi:hypothetical protein